MRKGNNNLLIVLVGTVMTVAFLFLAIYVITEEFNHIDKTFEEEVENLARIIKDDENIVDKLKNQDLTLHLDLEQYTEHLPESYYLIVLDETSKVYYTPWLDHPVSGDLGKWMSLDNQYNDIDGIYEGDSFVGRYYVSGSNDSIRAFLPVFKDNEQVGIVCVAVKNSLIQDIKTDKFIKIGVAFGIGLSLSIISLIGLTRRYKSELLGYAPAQIAMLYAENNSVIEQINEGIITVDEEFNITRVNKTLLNMFELKADVVGKPVFETFPHVEFKQIIEENKHITNKYRKINNEKYLMNAFPLYLEEKTIGATAIFRSHFEVDSLLDQIKGYQSIAEALRSQKHEFQNKLHVVLGLIKMKDYEKAENYIMENVYTTNLASDYYTSRIKDDRVLALFVGKEIQSNEYNASLLLTSDSYMTKIHNPINSDDIVVVLGNLIDNSFEAYRNKDLEDKKVVVDIFEDEDQIKITVIDQAGGIDPKVINKMFERGVSSKHGDSRGTGLSLVNEIITVYNGVKNVNSTIEETRIEIILMKVIS